MYLFHPATGWRKGVCRVSINGKCLNVEATGSNVKQLILKKTRDLHEEIIDATAIGSLKNWPSENNEGTKYTFTDGILVTFLLMLIFYLCLRVCLLFILALLHMFSLFKKWWAKNKTSREYWRYSIHPNNLCLLNDIFVF